jgi:hypothetical protein
MSELQYTRTLQIESQNGKDVAQRERARKEEKASNIESFEGELKRERNGWGGV